MNPIIHTDRLTLRPLVLSDAPAVFTWASDPLVTRFMPYTCYQSVADGEAWISSIKEADGEFAICLADTGRVIGTGSVCFDPEENAYAVGYNLHRDFWGRGYATEAAQSLIHWAHTQLGARDFYAKYAAANAASGRVLQKCGFANAQPCQYSRFDGSETFDAVHVTLHLP